MARSYYVEVTCQASAVGEELERHLDEVMDALQEEPGIADGDIGANLSEGTVVFCLHLDAANAADALQQAHVIARSALHKAGGGTPRWDSLIKAIREDDAATSVRPSEMVNC
jgi:hypothetical protein